MGNARYDYPLPITHYPCISRRIFGEITRL
jgi:hypothetical protein